MRALPLPIRAALLALAASLLGHMALLGDTRLQPDAPPPPRAVQLAWLPPTATPEAPPVPVPPALAPPQARPAHDETPPGAPATSPAEAPAAAPPLRLPGPRTWTYRLRQNGQDGEAQLDWQPEPDGRYSLRLTRRIGDRALPAQHSLGQLSGAGLAPQRYALQMGGRDRQAVNFDAEGRRISFSASPAQLELPDGAQDRLSWWLQLATLVQAAHDQGTAPGARWRVWVAGPRGELREWVFESLPTEADDAGLLHLRRQVLGPHDPGVEVWLDPARGFWPARLRQGDPETRGFEIRLADVNS